LKKKYIKKKNKDQYPYKKAVDWEHIFAFMNNVFPLDSGGKLVNKSYLTNRTDTNFLAPKDKTKGWSEMIFVSGYAEGFGTPTDTKSIG